MMDNKQYTATDPSYQIGDRVQVLDDAPSIACGSHGVVVGDTAGTTLAEHDCPHVIVAMDDQAPSNVVLRPEEIVREDNTMRAD